LLWINHEHGAPSLAFILNINSNRCPIGQVPRKVIKCYRYSPARCELSERERDNFFSERNWN